MAGGEATDSMQMATSADSSKTLFFACYLLCSQSPRYKGHTYIGFTVNPMRRIRQHNGEITSGAFRTKKKRPWEMVLCVHGFPSQVHALQFEWAWQHPHVSLAVREASSKLKSIRGTSGQVLLLYTMLNLPQWSNMDLTVNFLSTKHIALTRGCPSLPSQMQTLIRPLEDLPCYTLALSASDGFETEIDEADQNSSGDDAMDDILRMKSKARKPEKMTELHNVVGDGDLKGFESAPTRGYMADSITSKRKDFDGVLGKDQTKCAIENSENEEERKEEPFLKQSKRRGRPKSRKNTLASKDEQQHSIMDGANVLCDVYGVKTQMPGWENNADNQSSLSITASSSLQMSNSASLHDDYEAAETLLWDTPVPSAYEGDITGVLSIVSASPSDRQCGKGFEGSRETVEQSTKKLSTPSWMHPTSYRKLHHGIASEANNKGLSEAFVNINLFKTYEFSPLWSPSPLQRMPIGSGCGITTSRRPSCLARQVLRENDGLSTRLFEGSSPRCKHALLSITTPSVGCGQQEDLVRPSLVQDSPYEPFPVVPPSMSAGDEGKSMRSSCLPQQALVGDGPTARMFGNSSPGCVLSWSPPTNGNFDASETNVQTVLHSSPSACQSVVSVASTPEKVNHFEVIDLTFSPAVQFAF